MMAKAFYEENEKLYMRLSRTRLALLPARNELIRVVTYIKPLNRACALVQAERQYVVEFCHLARTEDELIPGLVADLREEMPQLARKLAKMSAYQGMIRKYVGKEI